MKAWAKWLALAALGCGVAAAPNAVDWQSDYDAAVRAAAASGKMVMVDVYTDWCGWCKKLDRDVYTDATVSNKLATSFVSVKVNPEKSEAGAKLAEKFGVRGYPYIVFVDGQGQKVGEIVGYRPAKEFAEMLDQIVSKQKK